MGPDAWRDFLYDAESALARISAAEYDAAIVGQARACGHIFNRPLAVLSGGAGTGKTIMASVIASIVGSRFIEINSTSSGVVECKRIFAEARSELGLTRRKTNYILR